LGEKLLLNAQVLRNKAVVERKLDNLLQHHSVFD